MINVVLQSPSHLTLFFFLNSFYLAGLQIFIIDDVEFIGEVNQIAESLALTLGYLIFIAVAFILILGSFAWSMETFGTRNEGQSIFLDPSAGKGLKGIGNEILDSLRWTAALVAGSEVQKPNSPVARPAYSIGRSLTLVLKITATAAFTAAFAQNFSSTSIESYDDLKGNTVCTVGGSSASSYLDENNNGFNQKEYSSVSLAVNGLFDKDCDAMVYDSDIVKATLEDRKKAGDDYNAKTVGDQFKDEFYGFFIHKDSVYYEEMSHATIDALNDYSLISNLESKYLGFSSIEIEDNSGSLLILWGILTPILISIATIIVGILYLRYNTEKVVENMVSREDAMLEVRRQHFADQYTEVSMRNVVTPFMDPPRLVEIMTEQVEAIKILLLNLLIIQRRRGDDCSQRLSMALFQTMDSDMYGAFTSQYFNTEMDKDPDNDIDDNNQGGVEMVDLEVVDRVDPYSTEI